MSSIGGISLSERDVTIMGVSIGCGLVLLVLCGAWVFFFCAMYKDKQTHNKIRKRWREAAQRARNVTRALSRRTQRRRRSPGRQGNRNRRVQETRVHPSRSNLHPISESTPVGYNDINNVITEQLNRSKNEPNHTSLARIANSQNVRPLNHHNSHHSMLSGNYRYSNYQDGEEEDFDVSSLLPRANLSNSPPPYESVSRLQTSGTDLLYNAATAPPFLLPGAVPTPRVALPRPTQRQETTHPPYNPEFSHLHNWPRHV